MKLWTKCGGVGKKSKGRKRRENDSLRGEEQQPQRRRKISVVKKVEKIISRRKGE